MVSTSRAAVFACTVYLGFVEPPDGPGTPILQEKVLEADNAWRAYIDVDHAVSVQQCLKRERARSQPLV